LIAFDLDHIPAQQIILVFDFPGPDMSALFQLFSRSAPGMTWKPLFRPGCILDGRRPCRFPRLKFSVECHIMTCVSVTPQQNGHPLIAGIAGPIAGGGESYYMQEDVKNNEKT
jgi:hypothetical protein